jgi:cytochrome c peroxidase
MTRRPATLASLSAALMTSAALIAGAIAQAPKYPPLAPLPPVSIPTDNPMSPAKIELGRLLFFDDRLSGNGAMGCHACHQPQLGWGTGSAISFGYPGTTHWRNSQTILNSAYYNKLFWDGAVTSLEAQAPSAAGGAVAGNGDDALMEMRLAFVPEYRKAFRDVFGTEWPMLYDAWRAIAAYQRTIVSDAKKVPFDRFANGDRNALNDEQKRGLALFNGKANCIACHNGPLASDQKFYRTDVPQKGEFTDTPEAQITFRWEVYQKGVTEKIYRSAAMDHGLFYVTQREADIGRWRVPSLRELKYTAPFMHNGAFDTLAEVIAFYDKGGGPKAEGLKPLNLTAQEKADLEAFLNALSMDAPLLDSNHAGMTGTHHAPGGGSSHAAPKLPETKPLWTAGN